VTGRRSSAVELALRLVRDGATPSDAAKAAGCHVRSVNRAIAASLPDAVPIEQSPPPVSEAYPP
jgi:hypothetical protein